MSKILYTRFTKLIINHFISCNKSIPYRSNSKLHSAQDDQPITKLSNAVKGDYKFGMEIPDIMISDAIKNIEYPNKLKKDVVPRKTRTLTIAEETVVDTNSDAILYSSCLKENKNETNDTDDSDMDLSNDNPDRDDDAAGFSVFMYNKSEETPNSTYLSPTATSFSSESFE
nr:hypothetical protein [Tanacetum cinerariifolium]